MDLSVNVGDVVLRNPLIAASGTYGFGREMRRWQSSSALGGICSKGITRLPREGNRPLRVAETEGGMLNSIGLQNPGIEAFLRDELAEFAALDCLRVVNVAGSDPEEYADICARLDQTPVDVIELNLSCPNVRAGCMSIGADPDQIALTVGQARRATGKPLWVKLTPNVRDIGETALAAEAAGADALVLINTLLGMAIDWRSRRPVLHNNTGGLSGPAIKPVALRMLVEARRRVRLPLVGVGGIRTAEDVFEFMLAGASAVQIGTATLVRPTAISEIAAELPRLLGEAGVEKIRTLTGQLEMWTC